MQAFAFINGTIEFKYSDFVRFNSHFSTLVRPTQFIRLLEILN